MAFKQVADLNPDVTISLGGLNKKSGKSNPKSIEGYYVGRREVEDRKKKSGKSYIYVFQTAEGNIGVWGKTDMDKKMSQAILGCMTRVTHTGMRPTPNGDMYTYSVEIDEENTTNEAISTAPSSDDTTPEYGDDVDADEDQEYEQPARPVAPRQPRSATPEQQNAVMRRLRNN